MKLTKGNILNLIGKRKGKIVRIKDVVCFRKPAGIEATKRIMSHYKAAIGMVSSYNIYRKPNTPYCSFWCNCFKDERDYFPSPKPIILLSESDFVDPACIPVYRRSTKFKWDFFYFTIGGQLGARYKGIDLLADSLPTLCGKYNLKGIIIKYAIRKLPLHLNKTRKKLFSKYSKNLKIVSRKLRPRQVAQIMQESRFGFFPNKLDCSPLMLAESLVRDCPIMVNKNILGGWKYIDAATGAGFDKNEIEESIETMLGGGFHPRDFFMSSAGYLKSSLRLASFAREHLSYLKSYKALGFAGSEKIASKYWKSI